MVAAGVAAESVAATGQEVVVLTRLVSVPRPLADRIIAAVWQFRFKKRVVLKGHHFASSVTSRMSS